MAALAYSAIARAVDVRAGEHVVDAYCGVGGIALTLARGAPGAHVLGIEENAAAIDDAAASAALNGVASARFVAGDVAMRLRDVARDEAR